MSAADGASNLNSSKNKRKHSDIAASSDAPKQIAPALLRRRRAYLWCFQELQTDERFATRESLKAAYLRVAKLKHPDKRPPAERQQATEQFKKLLEAWEHIQKKEPDDGRTEYASSSSSSDADSDADSSDDESFITLSTDSDDDNSKASDRDGEGDDESSYSGSSTSSSDEERDPHDWKRAAKKHGRRYRAKKR